MMSQAAVLSSETYLPDTQAPVAEVHEFLRIHDRAERYYLAGASPDDRVQLPPELHRILRQVVDALDQGLAVTIAPLTQVLTTQQAADLLGVSRPTVIKLLDDGKIRFERIGSRRRIMLRDLLMYREQRRAEQYAALVATSSSIDDEQDAADMLAQMREARRAIAERRRRAAP